MTPTARHWAKVAVALALVSCLAACSGNNGEATPPPPSQAIDRTTTKSTPPADPQAGVKAKVLDAYLAFWRASTAARAHPRGRHPQLAKFAIDKALASEQATIVFYRQQGFVSHGAPELEPSVVDLVDSGGAVTAVVRDCIDISNVKVLNRDGKSALAPSTSFRHQSTAKAQLWFGRWVIREIDTDRKRPC